MSPLAERLVGWGSSVAFLLGWVGGLLAAQTASGEPMTTVQLVAFILAWVSFAIGLLLALVMVRNQWPFSVGWDWVRPRMARLRHLRVRVRTEFVDRRPPSHAAVKEASARPSPIARPRRVGAAASELNQVRITEMAQRALDDPINWPPQARGLSVEDWHKKRPAFCAHRAKVIATGNDLATQLRDLPEKTALTQQQVWRANVDRWLQRTFDPFTDVYWGGEAQQKITSDAMAEGAQYERSALPPAWRQKEVARVAARVAWLRSKSYGCSESETSDTP